MSDRAEREKQLDWLYRLKSNLKIFIPKDFHLAEFEQSLDYAISSIKTDLKYDLLYEETTHIADADKMIEPTTKNCESCRYYGLQQEVCNYCYKCSLWTEIKSTTKNDLALIHTEGLDEEIRCTMCTNSMKSNRGCDGSCVANNDMYKAVMDAIEKRIQPTTKNDLGVDCISRQAVIDAITANCIWENEYNLTSSRIKKAVENLPSVTPQEPQSFKWCTDCKEYDQEKHCCHRYSKVIRDTVAEIRQEPVLDKINKMKSEIADSLEFWDYSPNNNPLARDILETVNTYCAKLKSEDKE